jgi:hypothetical protein
MFTIDYQLLYTEQSDEILVVDDTNQPTIPTTTKATQQQDLSHHHDNKAQCTTTNHTRPITSSPTNTTISHKSNNRITMKRSYRYPYRSPIMTFIMSLVYIVPQLLFDLHTNRYFMGILFSSSSSSLYPPPPPPTITTTTTNTVTKKLIWESQIITDTIVQVFYHHQQQHDTNRNTYNSHQYHDNDHSSHVQTNWSNRIRPLSQLVRTIRSLEISSIHLLFSIGRSKSTICLFCWSLFDRIRSYYNSSPL